VGNYFIAGPSSTGDFLSMFTATDHVYHRDNYVDLDKDGKVNGRMVTDEDFIRQKATLIKEPSALSRSNVKINAASDAWKIVMAEAGSSLKRDAVDNRIIGYFKSLGKEGYIFKTEVDAGGQPKVKPKTSKLKDTDADGIPDRWEIKNRLNLNDAADGTTIIQAGFTNLENYINSLVK
jgi:hypothetical protein